jgi:hypothetical protein
LPPLREAYVNEVRGLRAKGEKLLAEGQSPEQVAKTLNSDRRALGIKYKDLTPKPLLEKIYQRNLEKYGDRLGPTIDWLRSRGYTWEQIMDRASTPGGKDLGF